MEEMRQSVRIIPPGGGQDSRRPIMGKVGKVVKPPLVKLRVDRSAQGRLGYFIVSDNSTQPTAACPATIVREPAGARTAWCAAELVADWSPLLERWTLSLGEVDR